MQSASALSLAVVVFPGLMTLAASADLLTMTIPNAIPAALALAYFALAAALGLPAGTVFLAVCCGFVTLAAGFLMFCRGWVGGGDAKLAAATALWLGWGAIFSYAVSAAALGGGLTLVVLAARTQPLPDALARLTWIARLRRPEAGVPYGIALAAAGVLQYQHSPIWTAALG